MSFHEGSKWQERQEDQKAAGLNKSNGNGERGRLHRNKYILETSPDGITWKHRATFYEGERSRFSEPMSPEIMLSEARSFIQTWSMQHRSYDRDIVDAISERKHVRVIIEMS